ncbi:MAG: hypothetical protein U0183_33825 [Polyangiaceae bacterium]
MRSKLARGVAVLTLGVVLTEAAPARADDWYGYQTLAADGAATGLLFGAIVTHKNVSKTLFALSAATYLVASPVIHGANEEPGRALGALGLRVAAPLSFGFLGLVIGAVSDTHGNWGTPLAGAVIGFGLGIVTAMAIDAAALARHESPTAQGENALTVGRELYLPIGGSF